MTKTSQLTSGVSCLRIGQLKQTSPTNYFPQRGKPGQG